MKISLLFHLAVKVGNEYPLQRSFADKGRVFDNVGLIREDFGPKIVNTARSPFPLNLVFLWYFRFSGLKNLLCMYLVTDAVLTENSLITLEQGDMNKGLKQEAEIKRLSSQGCGWWSC